MLRRLLLLFSLFLFTFQTSSATHLWGGELSYQLTSYDPVTNKGLYLFTMELYRECTGTHTGCGFPQPLADFDTVIFVSIYDSSNTEIKNFQMAIASRTTLSNIVYGGCQQAPPSTCVEQAVYQDSTLLDHIPGGYTVNYQRCCRTWDIVNIVLPACPDQPDQGMAWSLPIPTSNLSDTNSSATFNLDPPTVLCLNQAFEYDHSASDADGDSLVYSFCDALTFNPGTMWNGGIAGTAPNPALYPSLVFPVPYASMFSGSSPITADLDTFKIDPISGIITGTPTFPGIYVVAVCVSEYRNGNLICSSRRDLNFNVDICANNSVVGFNTSTNLICKEDSIQFNDVTPNATSWLWDFGDGNVSTEQHPSHRYTASGSYDVSLDVQLTNGCSDSLIMVDAVFVDTCTFTGFNNMHLKLSNELILIPNPAQDKLTIRLDQAPSNENIAVTLSNMQGVVSLSLIVPNSATFEQKIDLSGVAKGIYMLSVKYGDEMQTKKLVIY